jgi:hypothetical protein
VSARFRDSFSIRLKVEDRHEPAWLGERIDSGSSVRGEKMVISAGLMRFGTKSRRGVARSQNTGPTDVPGPELERAVAIAARSILDDKAAILEALQVAGLGDADINPVFTLVAEWSERLLAERERSIALVELVEKAVLTDEGIRLGLKLSGPEYGSRDCHQAESVHLSRSPASKG